MQEVITNEKARQIIEAKIRYDKIKKALILEDARKDLWNYLCYIEPEFYTGKIYGEIYIIEFKNGDIDINSSKNPKSKEFLQNQYKDKKILKFVRIKNVLGRYEIVRRLKNEVLKLKNQNIPDIVNLYERMDFSDIDITKYEGRKVLKPMVDGIQGLINGEIITMAGSMPPRMGKSVTVNFASTYMLGLEPMGSIMRNCGVSDLAKDFTKSVRGMIDEHQQIREVFPKLILDPYDKGALGFKIKGAKRVSYFGWGITSTVIGKGCSIMCASDDLFGSFTDASSPVKVNDVWTRFTGSHKTRAEGDCFFLDIGTRWGLNDVITRNIREDYYDVVVNVAAIDKDGDTTCEAWKTTEQLLDVRKITDPHIWECEYMQNPIPKEGLMFPNGFKEYDLSELPKNGEIKAICDPADKGKDYLCMIIYYLVKEEKSKIKNVYVLDIYYTQDNMDLTVNTIPEKLHLYEVNTLRIETNKERFFPREIKRVMAEKGYNPVQTNEIITSQNKQQKIKERSAWVQEYIHMPRNWKQNYPDFHNEVSLYSRAGKNEHDDGTETLANIAVEEYGSLKKVMLVV